MARLNIRANLSSRSLWTFYLLLLLWLWICSQDAVSHSTVQFLPGFQGTLPFELETGYVGVDESEDVQVFYYFIKSEANPKEDPLLLWLTGGPGCSSFSALVFEIGPLHFQIVEYNGSLPNLELNPHSWTKASSIIFADLPVGTGFSYARKPQASHSGDFKTSQHAHMFMRKWLIDHPEFMSNPFYVGGGSYSGMTLPIAVQYMSNGNEKGIKPFINLKGYILGNPITVPSSEGNLKIPFAHGMGLISDELYESLKISCGEEYQIINPSNRECMRHVQAYSKCISGIELHNILEPSCDFFSPKPREFFSERRLLYDHYKNLHDAEPSLPPIYCRSYGYSLCEIWVNDNSVREALHIKKGSVGKWKRCNFGVPYTHEVQSSFEYHVNLSGTGRYRSLIYSGDHDMIAPFIGTQAWIRSLNYSIVDNWRSWIVQGQVAGYTRTYSNGMTFVTVKGAGHTPAEYKPEGCYHMFEKWVSGNPL